ncbi:hypothetical protein DFH08DRAFT_1054124 [Mycena albidolilacea]|uniref:Uncharacterized protein n=1 Tax=Mycena albidolilacea TaxID=1033008 RepID=A0AAD6Z4B1_9AGAR|nr:hypothetical protein DFH08DRAFT_1054124 [Mycena albidolilacea]
MSGRALSLILPLLTKLKQISIIENGDVIQTCIEFSRSWNKMELPLQSTLANMFLSPRLEAVHLHGLVLESPCHLLLLFSEVVALEEMLLSCLYFTQGEGRHEPWPESQLWRPRLQSLLLNVFSTDFCQYLANPHINLTHVRTLTLETPLPKQRKTMVQATKLRLSRDVKHLGLYLAYNFEPMLSEYSPTYTASTINQNFRIKLLGVFLKTCPHNSCLEYIALDSFADLQQHTEVPELYIAINATVDHLPALKIIEMRWIVGEPSATCTQWKQMSMPRSFCWCNAACCV